MEKMENKKIEELINKVAKGHVQRSFARTLLTWGVSGSWCNYMKAQSRYSGYCSSISNLLARLDKEGIKTETVTGKCGGYWTAKTKIA